MSGSKGRLCNNNNDVNGDKFFDKSKSVHAKRTVKSHNTMLLIPEVITKYVS